MVINPINFFKTSFDANSVLDYKTWSLQNNLGVDDSNIELYRRYIASQIANKGVDKNDNSYIERIYHYCVEYGLDVTKEQLKNNVYDYIPMLTDLVLSSVKKKKKKSYIDKFKRELLNLKGTDEIIQSVFRLATHELGISSATLRKKTRWFENVNVGIKNLNVPSALTEYQNGVFLNKTKQVINGEFTTRTYEISSGTNRWVGPTINLIDYVSSFTGSSSYEKADKLISYRNGVFYNGVWVYNPSNEPMLKSFTVNLNDADIIYPFTNKGYVTNGTLTGLDTEYPISGGNNHATSVKLLYDSKNWLSGYGADALNIYASNVRSVLLSGPTHKDADILQINDVGYYLKEIKNSNILIKGGINNLYWPFFTYDNYATSNLYFDRDTQPGSIYLSSVNINGLASNMPSSSDVIHLLDQPCGSPIKSAFLSGFIYANDFKKSNCDCTDGTYLISGQVLNNELLVQSSTRFFAKPSVPELFCNHSIDPLYLNNIKTLSGNSHAEGCRYLRLKNLNYSIPSDTNSQKYCECNAILYSPFGSKNADVNRCDVILKIKDPTEKISLKNWTGSDGLPYPQSRDCSYFILSASPDGDVGYGTGSWSNNLELTPFSYYAYIRYGLDACGVEDRNASSFYCEIDANVNSSCGIPIKPVWIDYNPTTGNIGGVSDMKLENGSFYTYDSKKTYTNTVSVYSKTPSSVTFDQLSAVSTLKTVTLSSQDFLICLPVKVSPQFVKI